MSEFPEMKREYTALELTAQTFGGTRYSLRASYVLSKNYGNYRGLLGLPNLSYYEYLDELDDAEGLLDNDRTHVFKLSGSYRLGLGFSAGTSFVWQSGTPLSVMEVRPGGFGRIYVQQRGTAGRTPSIWDLNFRFVYCLGSVANTMVRPRLIADVLHVGSEREAVDFDQLRSLDGSTPNPTYGMPTRYQSPTAVRLGFEVDF